MSLSFGAQRRMKPGDEDQRYRLSITLLAEQRPKYWNFHCCRCTTKVVELSGVMLCISDSSDMTVTPDYEPAPMAIECSGKWCRTWYEFLTLSGRE